MINWGEKLEEKIRMLPDSPGCYLMKDASGEIIYVGKAVNLKNRVRSYFRDTAHTPKVAAMIAHIDDFDILLCETNLEALILECNLIKLHKPYYNILLKDDKHYPYLKVDMRQPFPRLELCRKMEKDGAKYFGPYIGANPFLQAGPAAEEPQTSLHELRHRSVPCPLCRKVQGGSLSGDDGGCAEFPGRGL